MAATFAINALRFWYCVNKKDYCPCCNQKFELPNAVLNKRTDTVIREFLKLHAATEEEINHWENRVVVGIQRRRAYNKLYGGSKFKNRSNTKP